MYHYFINEKMMKKNKKLSEIWKQTPPDYYDQGIKNNIFQYLWHTNKIRVFKKILKDKKFSKILDVGCAGGLMTGKILSFFPKSRIIGVDVYSDAIKFAKYKYPSVKFYKANAHKLPFPDNSFNLIVCYETIEHVFNPQKVLEEIHRLAKKNSTIILAMDSGNLMFRFIWWFWEKTKGKVWKGAHLHPFHYNQLEKLIKKVKFKKIDKKFSHFRLEVIFIIKK